MKKISFNDNWLFEGKTIMLPHDAMIHRKRESNAESGSAQAYFPGGEYVYEKIFTVDGDMLNTCILFEFEGVYKNAKVFINGKEAGGCDYGYLPFFVETDGLLHEGENTIRVECENLKQPDSRWYSGAGIYRPVWMHIGMGDVILPESVKISTVSVNPAVIRIESETAVNVNILDGDTVVANGNGTSFELEIPNAKLWDEDNPYLYSCRAYTDMDEYVLTFAIRTVEANKNGLFINGKKTYLRGGCVHHDSGILGAATYDESEYRRVKKLKDAGYNAIRSSHNPASRAMLDACDKLGVYMMDETWDMWFFHKNKYDYADKFKANFKADIEALVSRDFNHPSVILYSIGNEVSEPAKPEGLLCAKEMVELLHSLDSNRLVTGGMNLMIISSAKKGKGVYNEDGSGRDDSSDKKMSGMNSTMFNMITNMVGTGMNKAANSKKADEATTPILDMLDVAGYNYASGRYPLDGKAHPDRVIVGSETFPQDIAKNWAMVKKYPYLIGDFMWTSWDYLGEAGIGAWAYTPDGKGFNKPYPWLLADCGAFDILGNAGTPVAYARTVWRMNDKPYIAVQPVNHGKIKPAKAVWRGTNAIDSWTWKNCDGAKAVVEVYSDADSVELYINSKRIGKKKTKNCKAVFHTKYQTGAVEAVAYDNNGKELSRSVLASAKNDTELRVLPEKDTVKPNEICYVNIAIADSSGVVECNADEKVKVTVEGGELLAFGSANPRTEETFDSGEYTTYYGRALAVIRAGNDGGVTVNANGKSASIEIE